MVVLITGGSGFIGRKLSSSLAEEGHEVRILTRKKRSIPNVKEFFWSDDDIEDGALDGIDALIHLAGESIAGGRWTKRRKTEIIESRTKTLRLLSGKIVKCPILIGASGVGFYGGDRGEELLTENSSSGQDFLAQCCQLWEAEERAFADRHSSRLVIIRTGVVLDEKQGALPKMAAPIQYGFGANLGSGKQWISWIHVDDLINIYKKALADSAVLGIINAVSPSPIRHSEFNKLVAKKLNRGILLLGIPTFILNMALGEMSVLVLGSTKVESNCRQEWKYPTLDKALDEIYRR
jgi:uncharacterized protein (TIGR01777 family)